MTQEHGLYLTREDLEITKNFMWAKRIYTYSLTNNEYVFSDGNVNFDCDYSDVHFGCSHNRDIICSLLKFVECYKKRTLKNRHDYYMTFMTKIIVLLFGLQYKTLKEVEYLRNFYFEDEKKCSIIDALYEDLCVVNCLSDGSTESIITNRKLTQEEVLSLSNIVWTNFFEESDDQTMYKAFDDVYSAVNDLFRANAINLDDFIVGRNVRKKYFPFIAEHDSGMDVFGRTMSIQNKNITFIRNSKKYIVDEGKIYTEGIYDTIELMGSNNFYESFSIKDSFIITYIWKYMESYLRNLSKYKTRVSYKYGGYRCIDAILNSNDAPAEIIHDYSVLKRLLETNEIKNTIYNAMEIYMSTNQEEFLWWKDRFTK